jgi:N-acetylneuraminic acid mutarotase
MLVFRGILVVLGLLVASAIGAGAWLYATPPQPRTAAPWMLGPPLPGARGELATAAGYAEFCRSLSCPGAERLYVLGGLSGLFWPEDSVAIYDPNRRLWAAGPPLPAPRHHLAAARLGQDLYVSGGTDVTGAGLGRHDWPPTNSFWRLTPGWDRWEPLTPMIEPRWGHRMVAHDGRLYVVGGRGRSGRVLIYALGKGWTFGAAIPRERDHLSVIVAGGKLWAIGGRDPSSLARVDIYDPVADRWQPGPDLPHATSGAAEASIDGIIFVFGGEEPDLLRGRVNDRHWKLDTTSPLPRWEPAPFPPLAVHGTDGVVLQGTIAIAGGASRHGALSAAGWTRALQLFNPALGR